jgi:hypothetical protein
MLRHSAFFMLKEGNGAEEMLWMTKGSAYMRFTCPSVRGLDFGTDLFGGSTVLAETKPWKRTPRWRSRLEGPPSSYDVALHLDFDDQAGIDDYNKDDVHHEVAVYNAAVCQGEYTARIDWWYDGGPLITRDSVRHAAMFLWDDGVDEAAKEKAFDAVRRLGDQAGVERLTIGTNVGTLQTDYDWILDLELPDPDTTKAFLASEAYADAMRALAGVTKHEWTARMSHTMHGL